MAAAARVQDPTGHPGLISGPGVITVTIGGKPAAVMGDSHTCAFPPPPAHPPSTITKGSTSVFIGGRAAARVGDVAGCGAPITVGFPSVEIGG